jgi:hypothetical protein
MTRTAFHLLDVDTPDVSSTLIRARLNAGLPIEDLVPAAVARYILNHRLYVEGPPEGVGPSEGGPCDSSAVNDLHGKTE